MLTQISDNLSAALSSLEFSPPVTHVLDPLDYARAPHHLYLERYGAAPKEVVFLGMNPGPFGMAQTGVPFGEIDYVRRWMGIEAPVRSPKNEHPKRPIEGFDCSRSEVSGRRLWGWAEERFGPAERFFERFFVVNYCPLLFLEESGRNFTPDKLPVAERRPLMERCDEALRKTVETLACRRVVGVGKFAEKRARRALSKAFPELVISSILHPSPASPAANRGWAEQAERQLRDQGIALPA